MIQNDESAFKLSEDELVRKALKKAKGSMRSSILEWARGKGINTK